MPKKLNSMRWLEQHDIAYEVIEFDDSIHSAEGVAEFVGVGASQVFKTLVVLPDTGKPLLVLMDGDSQLDLKALARASGHKQVKMAAHAEAEKLTNLKVGGISPLALTAKNWRVYIDASVQEHETIYLSAGQRGVNLKVNAQALINALNISVVACRLPA